MCRGTSQYMALGVIRGETYDGRCDWWSIGIIIYEVSSNSLLQQWLLLNQSLVSVRMNSILL